jgi:hypothetical protein
MKRNLWTLAALLPLVAFVVGAPPARADYRQLGAHSSDTSDYNAVAVRTTMTAPATPVAVGDGATRFFWIGTYMSDGSFYQAGLETRWVDGCTSLEYFVYAFDASPQENTLLSKAGPCGGITGTHTFTLKRTGPNGRGGYYWQTFLDNSTAALSGSTYSTPAASIGSHTPYVISETSAFTQAAVPDANDQLPGVKYYPALQVSFGSGDLV